MPPEPGKIAGTGADSGATSGQTENITPSDERTNSDDRYIWEQNCEYFACRAYRNGAPRDGRTPATAATRI